MLALGARSSCTALAALQQWCCAGCGHTAARQGGRAAAAAPTSRSVHPGSSRTPARPRHLPLLLGYIRPRTQQRISLRHRTDVEAGQMCTSLPRSLAEAAWSCRRASRSRAPRALLDALLASCAAALACSRALACGRCAHVRGVRGGSDGRSRVMDDVSCASPPERYMRSQ